MEKLLFLAEKETFPPGYLLWLSYISKDFKNQSHPATGECLRFPPRNVVLFKMVLVSKTGSKALKTEDVCKEILTKDSRAGSEFCLVSFLFHFLPSLYKVSITDELRHFY